MKAITDFKRAPKGRAPKVNHEMIAAVVKVLAEKKMIMTALEIGAALGVKDARAFKRRMRVIAEQAVPQIVSWPGSPGYVLWELATTEILDACEDATVSQIKLMTHRLIAYRTRRYRRQAPAVEAGAVQEAFL